MPTMQEVVAKLRENSKEDYQEVERLLVKIAENILKDPDNIKIRTLRKSNATVAQKILKSPGGLECLTFMGFRESEADFSLPRRAPLQNLRLIRDGISAENVFKEAPKERVLQQVKLPPFVPRYKNEFLRTVEQRFHMARAYDDRCLHEQARELVAEAAIEKSAAERMRAVQKGVLAGDVEDPNVSMQEVLLLELLSWFKGDFFSWVDNPECEKCGGTTKLSHMSTDSELLRYTDRVEMHKCVSCGAPTPFPRFTDLNILLATRRGRCGEWANAFTLLCRSMGWDARYVSDETDHAWTEVYSAAQRRWLHCDPCENVCDAPLMYETGWGKRLSYVMAYSGEEVQDVTWRYTGDHAAALRRRDRCGEPELVDAIVALRSERQSGLSESRRAYLSGRALAELAELMVERPAASDGERRGRTSGSLAWRLARGETRPAAQFEPHVWRIGADGETDVSVGYCTASDRYEVKSNVRGSDVASFASGALKLADIFRKEEPDWKTVYLCRKEGANNGSITWAFQVESDQKAIEQITVHFDYRTFETGNVKVTLSNRSKCIDFDSGQKELVTTEFANSKYLEITAELTGGKGNVSWQHAQLFRQSSDSVEYPFAVKIKLK